jgi:uncharacterized protein (DUF849 family)
MYNNSMNDLIINFTPTGMIPTKKMTPYVPVSQNEIIEAVHEAYNIGITLVHLHVREKDESPSYKASIYEKVIEGIKKHCKDLVICVSLSGRSHKGFKQRSEVIELQPDMASLTLGSLNSPKVVIQNSPCMIQKLALKMKEYGVKPELEAFDSGMVNYAKYLIKKNILSPPYYFNLIFGMISNVQSDPSYVGLLIRDLPDNSLWSLGGVGNDQLKINTLSIAYGGGVRVGLEDNIYYDYKRSKLATNFELLKRVHVISEIFQRKIMSSKTFGEKGFYNAKIRTNRAL